MNGYPLEIVFEVNDLELKPLFKELERFSQKTVPDLVIERAGLMSRYLAENTQPVAAEGGGAITNDNSAQGVLDGGSLVARDLGRMAVRRDLRRVYASPSGIYEQMKAAAGPKDVAGSGGGARAFYKALKSGNVADAKRIMQAAGIPSSQLDVMVWDDGARHKRLRNSRGRVNLGNKPQVVSSAAALRAYRLKTENNVGYTKAGWVNAGRQVSHRGMSQIRMWIKKHTAAPGRGVYLSSGQDFQRVVLTNLVPWASEALPAHQFNRAQSQLVASMKKELEKILEKLAGRL